MPVHKIPRASLHEALTAIERDHEAVVSITPNPDDPEFYDVVTHERGEQVETRGAA